jgi:oligopeptide/dipeptide ABC transporter ATP-binding protein
MAENSSVSPATTPVVELKDVRKYYTLRGSGLSAFVGGAEGVMRAVDGVSLRVARGEALGLAGESGCGKTTTGKLLLRLVSPSGGQVLFNGSDISKLSGTGLKAFRRQAQLVFQNPYEALNPRFTIEQAIREPLTIHGLGRGKEGRELVIQALESVNLEPASAFLAKYPHQMSGGQLQRVVLARAMVLNPSFVVADEPVSMLDVSVRASVLNLMKGLAQKLNLAVVYISHDLSLIQYMCQRTAIMYLGRVVETGPTQDVISNPLHPYTQALIAAVLIPDPDVPRQEPRIKDMVPSAAAIPLGCRFHPRCPAALDRCRRETPPVIEKRPGHFVDCWLHA